MKKVLGALVVGLLIVGCENAQKPAPPAVPPSSTGHNMMQEMHKQPAKPDDEKKPDAEGDKAPAEGDKPADAPK